MRRMIFVEPGRLDWESVRAPMIAGPGEAIVKPVVMGRCDLDRLYLAGRMPLRRGAPIGHEIIGEIIAMGDEAAHYFHIGQRVIVPAQISCGKCRMCLAGETGRCSAVPLGASYGMGRDGDYGGGVAELVHVPFARAMLVPLPAAADPVRIIGLADMASDAWRAVGPALERRPGGSVLVMGGMVPVIGIYAAALSVCLGAGRVVYVDADPEHRQAAAAYGTEVAEHLDVAGSACFDVVVDAAGDRSALLQAIRACGPAAFLTSVAPPLVGPELPMLEMYYKGLTYAIGRPNCRHGHDPALHAWAACGFDPGRIGPRVFAFDNAIEAWLDRALYVAVTA